MAFNGDPTKQYVSVPITSAITTTSYPGGISGGCVLGGGGGNGGSGNYVIDNTSSNTLTWGGVSNTTYTINTTTTWIDPVDERLNKIENVIQRIEEEHNMRKKYPALGYAYEQYEVMLEICKSKEADDAAGKTKQNP